VSARFLFLLLTWLATFVVVVLDQVTKHAIRVSFSLGESKTVLSSFFNLTYVRNTGAVFGCFQHQNEWLVLVSLAVLCLIVFFYYYLINGQAVCSVAMGLIAGGIIGNLIDRLRLGWVTDFLDFYLHNSHWPAFNIADSAICAGVGLYLLASLLSLRRSRSVTKTAEPV
jgi:signal peptidase II